MKLKTAMLGLDEKGKLLLEAVSKIDYFEIQAVADKDTKLAEKVAGEFNCASYDDYRQLITQNQFDCLLVAAAIYSCDEYVRAAMKKKFNILKLAPPARNFEEAAEFVRLADEEGVRFSIANPRRFAQSFLALRQFIEQGRVEQIYLATAVFNIGGQPHLPWQSDPKLAGGGVLLQDCYGMVDQIILNFETPQQVYCLNTNTVGDRQQRLYLAEDTAIVAMKFSDTTLANLITTNAFGPKQRLVKLYGKDKILTASENQFVVSDALGQIIEESTYSDNELDWYIALLENFALSILSPDENKLCSTGRENLKNMAVIESAYLSARTAMPEEPGKILQMAQIEPTGL